MTATEELPTCTIDEVRAMWGQAARAWSRFVRDPDKDIHRDRLHGPAFLAACGDVSGQRVLDLGCGEGWCSRELVKRGATVAAIDVAGPMIDEALLAPYGQQVDYQVMDAVDVDRHQWPGPFDLVAACMSLHCMPEPTAALRAVRTVLASDGRLVISIPHPTTHARGGRHPLRQLDNELYVRAGGYFGSAPYRVRWRDADADEEWVTIRWSRPHSEYARMLKNAGFVICDELEPRADSADAARYQRLRNADQVPHYLILVVEPSRRPPSMD